MSFYSYQYLVEHNNEPNFLFIIGIIILAVAIFVTASYTLKIGLIISIVTF